MANTFKTFLNDDIVSTRTLLNEAVPITGSVVSGTYAAPPATNSNVKEYSHEMFTSTYDYPYASASANHLFDFVYGVRSGSTWDAVNDSTARQKKRAIYNQLAQVLVGHDVTGAIMQFDADGDITAGGTKYTELIALNFARLLIKDEIKRGSFELNLGVGPVATPFADNIVIQDLDAQTDYRVNSPVGEYGILQAVDGTAYDATADPNCGLIFYQAGVVVLSPGILFAVSGSGSDGLGVLDPALAGVGADGFVSASANGTFYDVRPQGANDWSDAFNHRISDLSFNNTTELNSTIYFCRLGHNDFNYSSNPTYLSGSKIIVKGNDRNNAPVSYVTSIGLYSSYGELLAIAKASEPLKKSSDTEITVRCRLDF